MRKWRNGKRNRLKICRLSGLWVRIPSSAPARPESIGHVNSAATAMVVKTQYKILR